MNKLTDAEKQTVLTAYESGCMMRLRARSPLTDAFISEHVGVWHHGRTEARAFIAGATGRNTADFDALAAALYAAIPDEAY